MYFLKVPWSRKVLLLSAELITNVEMLTSQTYWNAFHPMRHACHVSDVQ